MSGRPQYQDRTYLRHQQYADDRNLAARASIYRRFGTNPQAWTRWVFAQLNLRPREQVLECGCGPGWLWAENATSIPSPVQLCLTDLSSGMLVTAANNLAALQLAANFAVGDIADLPFGEAQFDLVVANHMLYHVPDRRQAFAEVARVLRPEGRFVAATNGSGHLRQFAQLVRAVFTGGAREQYFWSEGFSLENGAEQLAAVFAGVELFMHENELQIDDADAVIDYLQSAGTRGPGLTAEHAQEVRRLIEEEIAGRGAFRVTTAAGIFVARIRD